MSHIANGIFVGSFEDAYDNSVISNVTHILNVAKEIMVTDRISHTYRKIAIDDDSHKEDIRTILKESIEFIDFALKSNGKILIHCWEGKSRSVCVCIAYLCVRQHMKFQDALNLMITKRPETDIFPLYLEQLASFCKK